MTPVVETSSLGTRADNLLMEKKSDLAERRCKQKQIDATNGAYLFIDVPSFPYKCT